MKRCKLNCKLFVAVLLLPVLAACGKLFPDDTELVQEARDYLQEGDINAAAIELRNALQVNPENADARYMLGTLTLEFGDYATAGKEFRKARAAGWDEAQAQVGLARALLGAGDFAGVLEQIEVRETYAPARQAELLALRALAEAGLGNPERAWQLRDAAAELDASGLQVLITTIRLQLAAGQQVQAARGLQAALERYPDQPVLLLLHAGLAANAGDTETALEDYRKVIAADPPGYLSANAREARLGVTRLQILAGEYELAEAALRPLYGRFSKDPAVNYLGGLLAFRKGEYDLAEQHIFKVLQLDPDYSPAHLLYATVSYAQGNHEQAVYYLSKYLAANPDNIQARKLLGRAYLQLGQPENARTALQEAGDDGAGDAELLALIGMSELQGGNVAAGVSTLEGAVKTAPQDTALRSELARAYLAAGESNRAIEELEALLEQDSSQDQSRALLIVARLRAGQNAQAIDLMLEMLARNPDDPVLLTMAGSVFAVSGDRKEARKYFSAALKARPHYVPATMSLARIEELEGNAEAARTLYTGLVQPQVKSGAALLALARLARQQNRKEEMVGWLVKAGEYAPQDVSPRIRLAEYYLREGRIEDAAPLIKEAQALDPRNPEVLALQGKSLMAGRRFSEALVPLEQLVTSEPDSAFARTLLAECHLQLNQTRQARRQLEIALQKQPYFVPALVMMGTLELKAGDYDRALELSQRARQADPQQAPAHELAGNIWLAKGDHKAASEAYKRAWERKQSSGLAVKLARTMAQDGGAEEAAGMLETWLAGHPRDLRVRQTLGTLYHSTGEVDKAIAAYERVLASEPDNPIILNNLAGLYLETGNPAALEMGRRAYQATPDNPGVQDTYGWILVRTGQTAQGLELLQQAMQRLPDIAEVRYHYAVALLKSDREAEARKLLTALLDSGESFPGREEAQRLVGN